MTERDNTVDTEARQGESVPGQSFPNDTVARADQAQNPTSDPREVDQENLDVVRNAQAVDGASAEGPAVVTPDQVEEGQTVASAQAVEDARFRVENPDSPVVRAANPEVGGE